MKATTLRAFALTTIILTGCVDREAQKQAEQTRQIATDPVRVVGTKAAVSAAVFDKIEITGDVVTQDDVQVSPKVPGKIVSVFVGEGDSVAAGQVIAQLDASNANSQLQQALSQLSGANAQLQQALTNQRVGPERSLAGVRSAEAQLRSARAQLQKALNGARPEERAQAEWQVRSARQNLDTVQKEYERVQRLVAEGAIEAKRLEALQNQLTQATSAYNSALESQKIVQNAVRSEDIATAREGVRQAEQGLRNAQAQREGDDVFAQQVQAARAQVSAAQAQVQIARQNLQDLQVRAPFAGRVAGRPLQAGTVVGAGTPILRLIGGQGIYFEGQVPEQKVPRITIGRPVTIRVQALPGNTFTGRVVSVSPVGTTVGRLFSVRIAFDGVPTEVKPGMFARGEVVLQTIPNAVVVPSGAVLTRTGQRYVMVAEGDTAREVPVQTGLARGEDIQVTGVPIGSQIIIRGQEGLANGAKIRIDNAAGSQAGTQGSGS